MPDGDVSVVLAHGAWADGSSRSKVIGLLRAKGIKAFAAPLPLTSLADDVVALDRSLQRLGGPVVLAGHAYGGAVQRPIGVLASASGWICRGGESCRAGFCWPSLIA